MGCANMTWASKQTEKLQFFLDFVRIQRVWHRSRGKWLDMDNPRTFNEKLQWLKLYWRDDRMTICADKYRVREYIAEKVGPGILNDLYGVYERAEDINFEELPASFVLKVNHHSGGNVLCRDITKLDRSAACTFLNQYLRQDHFKPAREWSYKNIPRRIIAEKYLEENGKPPTDYKIFCFNGEPLFIEVDKDRIENHVRNCYDLEWNLLPFIYKFPNMEEPVMKPTGLKDMLHYAKILSADFPFVRVDFYCIQGRVWFGEMTFYPSGGTGRFSPESYDEYWGNYLILPKRQNNR